MAQFYPLTVTALRKTTRDAVVVSLRPDPADVDRFAFTQGQYLTFRRDFDGEDIRRSYSICAGTDDADLRIGIKKVAGGLFSNWANETLKPGDRLWAMPPMGTFHVPLDPTEARHYLAFAGGSGITPVLSLLKTTLAREPKARMTLVYANRAVNTIMFREELEDLKSRYMDRLSIVHVLESGNDDMPLFAGRVDAEKCAALFSGWIPIASVDVAFICGPEPMMKSIVQALQDHGLDDDQIKFELFATAQSGKHAPPPAEGAETSHVRATIVLDGQSHRIGIDPGQTVLEAALANDIEAPYACTAGVCSTCRAKILSGEVEMRANHALEDGEVARGYILSCQSVPVSDDITVDYDQ